MMQKFSTSSTGQAKFHNGFDKLWQFFASPMAAGIVLALATAAAMLIANSPLRPLYEAGWQVPVTLAVGEWRLSHHLLHWINDGLMAVFFLLVGLELKKELLIGQLAEPKKIILPAMAAVGGMLVPALVYLALNFGKQGQAGWAIPAATDIAFALGVLSLLGRRVPPALKVFLASIAIFDDIGAIVIIALFYSAGLNWQMLGLAAGLFGLLVGLNRLGVTRFAAYALLGVGLWWAMLESGLHATLAGVLVALCIPLYTQGKPSESPLQRLEHRLYGVVNFAILPLFAFANAGIYLGQTGLSGLFDSVPLGIGLGLVVGKPVGVLLASWLGVRAGVAGLPDGVNFRQVVGVALLCGIGFTMSLFIGGLAFEALPAKGFDERLGIVAGSLVAGALGYIYLHNILPKVAPLHDD